jgi:zinc transport system substrate-binding protein
MLALSVKLFMLICLAGALSGFSDISEGGNSTPGKLTVYVVNYPLKYFAERIGGEHTKAVFPAPAEVDPAYWNPDVGTISAYQQADLIFLNGAGYAKWVDKVSLPRSKLVNTSKKFKDQYIKTEDAVTHSHGPKGEHAHEDVAFTTWIDFDLAAKQAQAIAIALIRKKPELKKTIQQNYTALESDLSALDRLIKEIVTKNQMQPLMVSHPVYDYLAKRYGLNIKSVHWEPDEIPNHEQWMGLQAILKSHPAECMIWEGNPDRATVEKLKSLRLSSIVFDPCGNVPDKGDFMTVMRNNIANLKKCFP